MKRPEYRDDWPASWRYCYPFDLQEIWGDVRDPGYVCAYRNRQRWTLRLLMDVLPSGARVLDLGAAQGNFSLLLAECGYRVTWNDLRADLVDYVRLKHEFGEIDYAPGNAFELRFETQFDAVLITEIIEHVAHPDAFLRQAAALVRPGGYVVMTTPNGAYFRNRLPRFSECADPSVYEARQFRPDHDGHIFLLWPEEIRALATAAGLVPETVKLLTNPLTNGHVKTGPLLRRLPAGMVEALETASQLLLPAPLRRKAMVQAAARFRKPQDSPPRSPAERRQ